MTAKDKQEQSSDGDGNGNREQDAFHYDPNQIIPMSELHTTMNLLMHPVWIFDYFGRRNRWGNDAALELFDAATLEEFLGRDMTKMSDATIKRNEDLVRMFRQGKRQVDLWTFYPKGQPKPVKVMVRGIRLAEDIHADVNNGLPPICFFAEGIPLEQREIDNELLRGVEMLRHLPIAVCQFDKNGTCMYQNPEATLPDDVNETHDSESDTAPDTDTEEETVTNPQENGTFAKCGKENKHRKRESTSLDKSDTLTNDTNKDPPTSKRKKADCSLLHRFVDPQVARDVLQQINDDKTTSFEIEAMVHAQRGPTWSAIQLRQATDPVTGQPVILYSATDKSDAVQARKERQARERKSEFLAIMAHEIRTPLHQVTGFVDLLDQTPLDKEQKSFVGVLKASAQGLMTVINDVLDFSKLEAGKLHLETIPYEPLSVTKGSLEAVRATCEERHLFLRLEWDKTIPFKLKNDPNRLRQILLNLLSNAAKFTNQGGITLQVQYLTDDPANPSIKFTVRDTGIGISQEHMKVIFQKYQQADISIARNYGGTGLGLSICHLLLHLMGGSMGVDSRVGEGTSFWFVLPAVVPTAKDLAGEDVDEQEELMVTRGIGGVAGNCRQSSQLDCRGGLNVLVAEDNKVNQKLVVNMLRRMGHTSVVAENGKEAIELIQRQKFDICLMDIQMPVCDGLEATKRLRSMGYTDLPIYGLTASVGRSDYVELGFNDWLPKPIRMKELKVKLYHLKQNRQQEAKQ